MGLIKAAFGAVGSTLHDQWKEAIRCDDLGNDILMKKVSTETKVITKDSIIIVLPGQAAVIIDNGKVTDATAEDGQYTYDTSSSPSFFGGQFGQVFKEMWSRFTFNGATGKEQFVLFFNMKQIIDNKFGTPNPVPFQDWSHPLKNAVTGDITPMAMKVKCFGRYTFQITNPAQFMSVIGGTQDEYRKDELLEQMKSEVIDAFQNILNELGNSEHKVPLLELPSQTDEIRSTLNARVFDQPIRDRGLMITGFTIESAVPDDESNEKISNYEFGSNQFLQQGKLAGAYADAMVGAANNANGAGTGFIGLGMMNMASGGMVNATNQGVWQQPQAPAGQAPAADPNAVAAGAVVAGTEAAATAEEKPAGVVCPKCGQTVPEGAKFCPFCGEKLAD